MMDFEAINLLDEMIEGGEIEQGIGGGKSRMNSAKLFFEMVKDMSEEDRAKVIEGLSEYQKEHLGIEE